jgi:hypothetical protein
MYYGILTLLCKLLTILSLSADNSTVLGSSGTAHKFASQSPTECKPNTDFWFMMFSTASVTQSASASGEAGPPPVFFRVFFVLAATFLAFVFKFSNFAFSCSILLQWLLLALKLLAIFCQASF